MRNIKEFWLKRGLTILLNQKQLSKRGVFGTFNFAFSDEAFEQLRQAYIDFYNKLVFLAENERTHPKHLKIINVQMFEI